MFSAYKGHDTTILETIMATNTYKSWSLLLLLVIYSSFITAIKAKVVVTTVHTTVEIASTVQATPTVPSPASYTSTSELKDTVLRVSNDYRKAHDAEPLVWNDTLVEYSHQWAQNCIWEHSVRSPIRIDCVDCHGVYL
jgi:uncharacterized protein YkwD